MGWDGGFVQGVLQSRRKWLSFTTSSPPIVFPVSPEPFILRVYISGGEGQFSRGNECLSSTKSDWNSLLNLHRAKLSTQSKAEANVEAKKWAYWRVNGGRERKTLLIITRCWKENGGRTTATKPSVCWNFVSSFLLLFLLLPPVNVCFYSLRSFIFSILNYAILHRLGSLLTYITLYAHFLLLFLSWRGCRATEKKGRRENGMKTEGEKSTQE